MGDFHHEVQLPTMVDFPVPNGAKETDQNGQTGNFPDQPSTNIQIQKRHQRWLRIALYAVLVLVGQSAATLLGRQYYREGGKSKWLGTLVQLVGFPILLPYYCIPASKQPSSTNIIHNHKQPSVLMLAFVYVSLGLLVALNCYLYSVGLWYLPVSTYSLICSSQLAFNAFFSFFLNSLKFTPYIVNSLVLLTISSTLLVFQTSSSSESRQDSDKYVIGFICTLAASAGYGLVLSLTQVAFRKVLKKENFRTVLNMIVYQSLVATLATLVGLFGSEEFRGLKREMEEYHKGKASYVLNLSFTAITWQVFSVGCLGLILDVSSLFSNAISVLGLPIVPILAIIFFHDKMHGLKAISLILALWGFLSYTYQQYLDETKANGGEDTKNGGFHRDSPSQESRSKQIIMTVTE
ncbi:putative purine permease 10 [Senna tora]|uniref:Probable purine permease n=1 Tax=Senna tora TaxID=362788 RepID=A0A834X9P5_9FABA|nr:putative purine permease 10 [Senna tora]